MAKKEEFYKSLKEKLDEGTKFPSDYLYKFIVPTTKDQERKVDVAFANKKARISKKTSKTGKYISISILMRVKNSEEVIENYHSVENIEGLISL